MMVDVSVSFVLQNLKQSLLDNAHLITGIKDEVENLLDDLKCFDPLLIKVAYWNINVLKALMKWIRIVAISAEDVIDKFVIQTKRHNDKGVARLLNLSHYKRLREVSVEIRNIRKRMKKIRVTAACYLGEFRYLDSSYGPGQERLSPTVEEDQVVGFDTEVEEIINRLLEESGRLKVISIVGMPGLGKTTLANQVYKHPKVEYEFFTRIWLHVSHSYRRRDLFLTIISRFDRNITQYCAMCDEDLADIIQAFLGKGGKYMIVLDDVCSTGAWERIKIAFPENNKCNRILLTTRDSSVAKHCDEIPHYLNFLTADESWILLQKNVFFHKDKCPVNLEQTGKNVAKKCRGLPIAIVVIARALIESGKTPSEWGQVDNKLSEHVLNVCSMKYKKLVQMSYDMLSYNLKACFLYCAVFPRGFEIPSWRLIRLWVAEGFIQHKGHLSLECKAEEYLNDLANMNLVMVMRRRSDGKIKTFRVHDMLHEFCRQEAVKEEKMFGEVKLGAELYIPAYRRLCIHSSVLDFICSKPSVEHIRSFLTFSSKKNEMVFSDIPTIPRGFPLLRVFDIESIQFSHFSKEFYQLYHLRYFAFSSDTIKVLPRRIGDLRNIQTLIINTQQPTLDIQADIWNMTHLRHVHTNASAKLPVPVVRRSSKDILVNLSLQTLSTIAPESCTEEVFTRAPNLKKLGIRGKIAVLLEPNKSELFKKLEYLESLKLINDSNQTQKELRLPPAYIFPTNLRKLTLLDTWLDWKDMSVLGQLKHLEVLKLKQNGFHGENWKPEVGGFGSLLVLWIEQTNLAYWDASADNFPKLKHLVLISCDNLKEIPIGLADIRSFQLMVLQNSTKTAAISACEIQAKKEKQPQEGTAKTWFKLSIFPPDL